MGFGSSPWARGSASRDSRISGVPRRDLVALAGQQFELALSSIETAPQVEDGGVVQALGPGSSFLIW